MSDKHEILSRLDDLAAQSWAQAKGIDSDFLNLEEFSVYAQNSFNFSYADPVIWKEEWDRKVIHFGPGDAQIRYLLVESKSADYVELKHGDYMGAVLGLGLDRKVLGDIYVDKQSAILVVKTSISDFILAELNTVGRASVSVSLLDSLPENLNKNVYYEDLVFSSYRLDRFIATVFKVSRELASEYIEKGLVYVNHKQVTKLHHNLELLDTVNLRGFGKVKLIDLIATTKKSNKLLRVERYS